MEIEDEIFTLKIYKDQEQFMIDDSVNLIKRLSDKEELKVYHNLSKDEQNQMKNITKYNNEQPVDEVQVSKSEKSLRIFERIYKKKYESID